MLNGIDLGPKLIKSKNEFHLIGNTASSVKILEANLFVRKVSVEIKTVTISAGIQSKSIDNIFLGQIPKRCIIGMVDS